MFKIKEPVNSLTHLSGAVLSMIGMILMILKAVAHQSGLQLASALVFGVSLILLYSASTIYHWLNVSDKTNAWLRKLDHSMIYVLIAGTYTPVCLNVLGGVLGWTLFGIVWGLAIIGIILKLLWLNAPRWLYTSFYLVLGWLAIFFIVPIYKSLPIEGFLFLIAGGVFYTVGSVIYAMKPKKMQISIFGFHEIFHLFILGGSLAHFIMVNQFILK